MGPRKYKVKHETINCCAYGMIANEVFEEVKTMPQKSIINYYDEYEADKNTEKMLGLSYQSFIPLLIQKVQNQHKEINELKEEKEIISNKLEQIKNLLCENENTFPVSENKELLLHSDSIHTIENLEIYKDGLGTEQNMRIILLNILSLNQFLLKELDKIKHYLENL